MTALTKYTVYEDGEDGPHMEITDFFAEGGLCVSIKDGSDNPCIHIDREQAKSLAEAILELVEEKP